MRNIVVDHGIQHIQNSKKFFGSVKIVGDFNVELLNGYRISSVYENSVLTGTDAVFNTDVVFKRPVGMYANIKCNKINGMDVESLKSIVEDSTDLRANVTVAAVDELQKIVGYYSQYIDGKFILYHFRNSNLFENRVPVHFNKEFETRNNIEPYKV